MTTESNLLLNAVQNLTTVVKALEQTIREDYPKRKEVERRFATKNEAKTRIWLISAIVILSMIVSFLVTSSVLSYCFLTGVEEGGLGQEACNAIPGYHESAASNDALLKEFMRLQELTADNERRISRLERE